MKKKNSENFDFFMDKFYKVKPDTPESLNKDAIKNKILSQEKAEIIKLPRKNHFKAIASIAVCFVLIFSICIAVYPKIQKPASDGSFNNVSQQLLTFGCYDEINALVKELEENVTDYFTFVGGFGGGDLPSHSETYKQDEAVDEADIIKTDGKYIYYKHTESIDPGYEYAYQRKDLVDIYRAKNGKAELVSQIDSSVLAYDDNFSTGIDDMFLYKNRLIVRMWYYSSQGELMQATRVYNVSSPRNPKLICDYRQSGFGESRMIGNIVYNVTKHSARSDAPDGGIPKCGYGDYLDYVPLNDVCYIKDAQSSYFVIISAIDVITGERVASTKAVLGGSRTIYCNENNLYLTSNKVETNFDEIDFSDESDIENLYYKTAVDIIKIELNSNEIRFVASGSVDGYVLNQFSMDEKDGYFRIATTNYATFGNETSAVYVLDENMNLVGKTDDFAKGESIKAVRYNGDIAQVITYEETDPLFVIDLSNPEKPIIKGSLEIDGFSSLLVPISENRLLGIGYQTEETEGVISTCGLKLVLFDISDNENPVALDTKEFYKTYSQVQRDHKALVVNREKGYYAIPYYKYNSEIDEEDESDCGVITFEVNNDEIEITNEFRSDTRNGYYNGVRCVYIDDYIYTLGEDTIDDDRIGDVIINSFKY